MRHGAGFCFLIAILFLAHGCAGLNTSALQFSQPGVSSSQTAVVAGARAKDVETAAYILTSGRLLYQSATFKPNADDYCSKPSLSIKLANQGEFRLAVREASKGFFLGKNTGNAYVKAHAARDLSYAYYMAGDLDTAWTWANASLRYIRRSVGKNKSKVRWRVHKVIGDIEARRSRTDEAIVAYKRALGFAKGQSRAEVFVALANAEIAARNWDRADEYFRKAERAISSEMAPLIRRGRGKLALARGSYKQALDFFDTAAASDRKNDAYNRIWAHRGAAKAHLALGNTSQAIANYNNAINAVSGLRVKFRSEEFKTGFFGNLQSIFEEAITLMMKQARVAEAFNISEQARARAMLDLIKGRVTSSGNGKGNAVVNPVGKPQTAAAIRKSLPPNYVVVSYYVLNDRIFIWQLTRQNIKASTVRITKDALKGSVGRFRKLIENKSPSLKAEARKLYVQLIAPLRAPPNSTLLLVPHKSLHYLPFQALRGPRRWLIEDHSIATIPSASMLPVLLGKRSGQNAKLLALGNPDLGNPEQALPGAEREVEQIAAMYPSAQTFVRENATKARLIGDAPSSGVIHIAAHASVDELDPLYSVIRLASTNKVDGDLEAHEFYRLPLNGTKLVVLSACDSGLGRISSGDEFWGFKRTILGSGAQSALVTLWPVFDDSTARLMKEFYQKMKVQPSIHALRAAQLNLIRSKKFSDPVYWAPFVLIGAST